MELNKIYNEDCLEGMKKLGDETIDLTVTSPPYDKLRKYNSYSFDFENTAKELYRVTKKGGIVVWVVNDSTVKGSETGNSFKQALYFKEIGFNLHDTMIFAKNNPVPLTHNRYEQQFEYMFILSKGKPKTFNGLKKLNKTYNKSRFGTFRHDGNKLAKGHSDKKTKKESLRYNIWYYNVGNNSTSKDRKYFKHPAIFPKELAIDHILSWSNENDIVLDIFMGSGTTGVASLELNRNYIGFEISKEYCELANERIENHKKELEENG